MSGNSLRWSPEQLAEFERKRRKDVRPSLVGVDRLYRPSGKERSKFGNEKTDGYDSKREAGRAQVLKLMQSAGEIAELREQVRYELIPDQRVNGRRVERACEFIADFVYRVVATGEVVVEDAKGVRTDAYRIKRKLMLQRHGVIVQEV